MSWRQQVGFDLICWQVIGKFYRMEQIIPGIYVRIYLGTFSRNYFYKWGQPWDDVWSDSELD